MRTGGWSLLLGGAAAVILCANGFPVQAGNETAEKASVYHSPLNLAISPDGKTLYASDPTAGRVAVLDTIQKKQPLDIPVNGQPRGLALSADGATLYVAEHNAGTVAAIDTKQGVVGWRVRVGLRPTGLAVAEKTKRLYVCNRGEHSISVVRLGHDGTPREIKRIRVVREPSAVAVGPYEKQVVVANLLPHGVGTDPSLAAEISIIDAAKLAERTRVKLPSGSTSVNGLCISPDGKWAYVVHSVGHFNIPFTQLQRGWVHTYALSIVDLANGTRLVTVLLDSFQRGAADPYAVVCSGDGNRLWISHAGVHEVSLVDIGKVHELLRGKIPKDLAARRNGNQPNVWVRITQNRQAIAELTSDLAALSIAGVIRRVPSGGNGPRGLVLAPDGQKLYVANYYSGWVSVLDAGSGKRLRDISVGPQPQPDATRRGEIIFHDATFCFQRWHSCATCHPNGGRVDGLRWDFMRDGIANPKDTPSLVFVHKTEPLNHRSMFHRETARIGAKTGLLAAHFAVPTDAAVDDLLAYFVSLRPETSPRLGGGKLSESAERGKVLFKSKARCAGCHPAPYFTDKKVHNIGVLTDNEPDGRYDTPTLLNAYETAPYLHDGRALTIRDVLTVHNPKGLHGKAGSLSEKEMDNLVAYILSL